MILRSPTWCLVLLLAAILDAGAQQGLEREGAQSPGSEGTSLVEEYINCTNTPEVYIISPSSPRESRRQWQDAEDANSSIYLDLMDLVRTQYLEDLNYSSYILDEFVNKRVSSREAMTASIALFELTSQTVDMVDQMDAPPGFDQYHNCTLMALINLEGYLWNMAKFYETNRRVYAMQAHESFNRSIDYYGQSQEIAKGFDRSLP